MAISILDQIQRQMPEAFHFHRRELLREPGTRVCSLWSEVMQLKEQQGMLFQRLHEDRMHKEVVLSELALLVLRTQEYSLSNPQADRDLDECIVQDLTFLEDTEEALYMLCAEMRRSINLTQQLLAASSMCEGRFHRHLLSCVEHSRFPGYEEHCARFREPVPMVSPVHPAVARLKQEGDLSSRRRCVEPLSCEGVEIMDELPRDEMVFQLQNEVEMMCSKGRILEDGLERTRGIFRGFRHGLMDVIYEKFQRIGVELQEALKSSEPNVSSCVGLYREMQKCRDVLNNYHSIFQKNLEKESQSSQHLVGSLYPFASKVCAVKAREIAEESKQQYEEVVSVVERGGGALRIG